MCVADTRISRHRDQLDGVNNDGEAATAKSPIHQRLQMLLDGARGSNA